MQVPLGGLRVPPSTLMSSSRVILDEQSFQKLLAAAYILQQQRDQLRARQASDDALRLSEIADTQRVIHTQKLTLQDTLQLVAERAAKITQGVGAAIYLVQDGELNCCAASGRSLPRLGESTRIEENAASVCLQSGEPFRCSDVRAQIAPPLPTPPASSLFAIPVHRDGRIGGMLEVLFGSANGFQERDIQSGMLLAGMVEEAFVRDAEEKMKQELAAERATMLAALERLKPQLEKLSQPQPQTEVAAPPPATKEPESRPSGMAGLGAFLLNMQEQQVKRPVPEKERAVSSAQAAHADAEESEPVLPNLALASLRPASPAAPDTLSEEEIALLQQPGTETTEEPDQDPVLEDLPSFPQQTMEPEADQVLWPQQQVPASRWKGLWRAHWADIVLVFASAVFLSVVLWAVWPRAAATSPASPTSDLTPLERMLVAIGLAEPPPAPIYQGNPNAKVWVDLQTAIYYCSGSDLYGKTSKGKYTTQQDALRDQFEPAYRRPCR